MAYFLSGLALSACSTQGASRYGDVQDQVGAAACGPAVTPCGRGFVYPPVVPTTYIIPAPCQGAQCAPVYPAEPVVTTPPPTTSTTIAAEPSIYESPAYEPLSDLPPIRELRPVVDEPVDVTCPEGSIPAYGGQSCIAISIPRK